MVSTTCPNTLANDGPLFRQVCYHRTRFSRIIRALLFSVLLTPLSARALTEGDYTYTVTDGQATITDFNTAYSGSLSITNELGGYPVTFIGNYAFYGCTSLASVTIPASVTYISYSAFLDCTGLTKITVDAANPAYASPGGVLFNKDVTILDRYPGGKTGSYAIPDSVKGIGFTAFAGCTGLTSVTIPDSVTSIGDSAFAGCTSLASVNIPDSVEVVGSSAFAGCSSLAQISVSEDNPCYASVNGVLFAKDLTTLLQYPGGLSGAYTIPDGVVFIESSAFRECALLSSVTIPASVTTIGVGAFEDCTALASVNIPESVTYIADNVFSGCASLTSVTIPAGVTFIGWGAFVECASLSSILFTGDAPAIAPAAFDASPATVYYLPGTAGWSDTYAGRPTKLIPLSYSSDDTQVTLTGLDPSYSGHLPLPAVLNGLPVTAIGNYAFYGCTSLVSVSIPASVTVIGNEAFCGCTALTSVTIPAGITSIGWYAFYDCPSLAAINVSSHNLTYASIDGVLLDKTLSALIRCPGGFSGNFTIPGSVTSIGNEAFDSCASLSSVTIPASVADIGASAFYGCTALTSVVLNNDLSFFYASDVFLNSPITNIVIGSSVTDIGADAFYGCTALVSVSIPASVTAIGRSAFCKCTALVSVSIPASVTDIGDNAFGRCTSLTTIDIAPENPNFTSIGGILFDKSKATLLQCPGGFSGAYTIPDSVTTIGDEAFEYCSSITSVTIPAGVTGIGDDAFSSCYALTSVTIPDSVTSIGWGAFSSCYALTSVTIPDKVTSIGEEAFCECTSLTSITIPARVTSIGDSAFYNCTSLTSVLFTGNAPAIDSEAFYAAPATLYYLPNTTGWGTTLGDRPTLLWNPTVQHDAAFGFASGGFGFNISGTADIPVVVQATTNLTSGVWTSLTNTTLGTSGSMHFSDPSSSTHPARFYRIVWP